MSIGDLAQRLARLDLAHARAEALAAAAGTIARAVREASPAALAGSIAVAAEGDRAVIGSTEKAALDREYGTVRRPPRPFLAPVAAVQAEAAAEAVGAAVIEALRGF